MADDYQKSLVDDLRHADGYGAPQVGWRDQSEIFRAAGAPALPGALNAKLAETFVEKVYFLIRARRPISVYRAYETPGLAAPYGKDHPSFLRGLIAARNPGRPDGYWWTPARPSLAIDNLGLSSLHRNEPRAGAAITREWNRMDYWIEAELPIGATIYVGRAAPQQEKATFGGAQYGGGNFQFRLTKRPDVAFTWMKRYIAI